MSIRYDLLEKAMRDRSKLVQVQRFVTRKGKSFWETFWVSPGQVLSTDKVIGNKKVYDEYQKKVSSNPNAAPKKMDLDKLKAMYKQDPDSAYQYIDECGIKFDPYTDEKINWMHAVMACKKALGIPLKSPHVKKTASGAPTSKAGHQNATNDNSISADDSRIYNKGQIKLTSRQINIIKQGRNGAEKRVILKEILGSGKRILEYAKGLGLQWKDSSSESRNIMSASMALKKYLDTEYGTNSKGWTQDADTDKLLALVNSNDPVTSSQSSTVDTKSKDPDALEIPDGASEWDKKMITLLNSITDRSYLQLGAETGMVPENDIAKTLIVEYLQPEYEKATNQFSNSTKVNREFISKLDSYIPDFLKGNYLSNTNLFGYTVDFNDLEDTPFSHVSNNAVPGSIINLGKALIGRYPNSNFLMQTLKSPVFSDFKKFSMDGNPVIKALHHVSDFKPEYKESAKKIEDKINEAVKILGGDDAEKNLHAIFSTRTTDEAINRINEEKNTYDKAADSVTKVYLELKKKKNLTDSQIKATLERFHIRGKTQLAIYDYDSNGNAFPIPSPNGNFKVVSVGVAADNARWNMNDYNYLKSYDDKVSPLEFLERKKAPKVSMSNDDIRKASGLLFSAFSPDLGGPKHKALINLLNMYVDMSWGVPDDSKTKPPLSTKSIDHLPVYSEKEMKKIMDDTDKIRSGQSVIDNKKLNSSGEDFMLSDKSAKENAMIGAARDILAFRFSLDAKHKNPGLSHREGLDLFNEAVKAAESAYDNASAESIKQLREKALQKAKCSLRGFSDSEKKALDDYVSSHWTSKINGIDVYGYIKHTSIIGAEIRNSKNEEKFNAAVEKCKKAGKSTKILHHFHGTKVASGQGILGETGGFASIADIKKRTNGMKVTGAMLGMGTYTTELAGKSAGYYGRWGGGYNNTGILFTVDVLEGSRAHANKYFSKVSNNYKVDTVSVNGTGHGRGQTVRSPEMCSRNADFVLPKTIMIAKAERA